jgi:hypothetical protein
MSKSTQSTISPTESRISRGGEEKSMKSWMSPIHLMKGGF